MGEALNKYFPENGNKLEDIYKDKDQPVKLSQDEELLNPKYTKTTNDDTQNRVIILTHFKCISMLFNSLECAMAQLVSVSASNANSKIRSSNPARYKKTFSIV